MRRKRCQQGQLIGLKMLTKVTMQETTGWNFSKNENLSRSYELKRCFFHSRIQALQQNQNLIGVLRIRTYFKSKVATVG